MKNNFFFSIIIPTFNRVKKISKAIESILGQSYKNWELIIVDNYSNDGTKELVQSYNSKNIFFYKIKNSGLISRSRNYGIRKSKGEYLAFLDSDDWWDKNKLEIANNYVNKGHKFIYHDHYIYSPNRLLRLRWYNSRSLNPPVYDDLVYNGPAFATSSVVVHKTSFEKIKNFNISKKFIAWEDWDAWLRFAKQTDDFFHIQEKLSYITIDNENFSTEKIKIKNLNSFKNKYLKKNMHIPNWYIYTLVVCYFNCNFYFDVNSLFVKINFIKLNFLQKIKFIFIFLVVKFKLA
jgi:glycosyltransferase involved in cell wall biosynthesis